MTVALAPLPADLDAERSVLGSVLIRERIADVLGIVTSADFLLQSHGDIFTAMLDLSAARQPLDVLTVSAELRARGVMATLEGQEAFVAGLAHSTPTAENGRHYAEIVRCRATSRKLIKVCLEAGSRAASDSADEVMADLRVALSGLRSTLGGPVAMAEAIPPYLDALEARQQRTEALRVSTGIRALDNLLLGGGAMGQEIVIGGNPGSGKTSLATQWALSAAMAGVPALIFSLEMKRTELLDRILSFASGVDGSHLVTGNGPDGRGLDLETWKRIDRHARELSPLPLSIDDRKLTCDQIVSEALRWRDKHVGGLAVIAVDYLGIIRSTGKSENRQQEIGGWSRELKILAGDCDAALLLCAQLNRLNVSGGEPRKPVLSDLRDSGEIEQNADVVLFPWRSGTIGEIGVAKQRGGPIGAAAVRWEGKTTAFYDDTGDGFQETRFADG